MDSERAELSNRRHFPTELTLAGTAALLGLDARPAAAEPPPEKTTLRVTRSLSVCQAPQYIAEALFEAEGFTDVQFVWETAIPGKGSGLRRRSDRNALRRASPPSLG